MSSTTRPQGDQTRRKIIKAAQKLFAKHGFSGTSISDIAKKANVNRSLVFHHFTDKESLWVMVKRSFTEHLVDKIALDTRSLAHFLKQVVSQRFALYDQNPDLLRMAAWQSLDKESTTLQGGVPSFSPQSWTPAIKKLQELGQIKAGFQPELIAIFIASTISGALLPQLAILKSESNKSLYVDMVMTALLTALSTS